MGDIPELLQPLGESNGHEMSELIEIPACAIAGGQGTRLEALLKAESCVEVWNRRRSFCGRLVVALSVPMAYFLYRGQGIAESSARFVLVLWLLALACSILCASATLQAEHALGALVTMAGGRRLKIDDRHEEGRARP